MPEIMVYKYKTEQDRRKGEYAQVVGIATTHDDFVKLVGSVRGVFLGYKDESNEELDYGEVERRFGRRSVSVNFSNSEGES